MISSSEVKKLEYLLFLAKRYPGAIKIEEGESPAEYIISINEDILIDE